ncbi:MAG: DNA-binding protein [Candidimonas sp.]|nr:MAG: DNA-binding protein [Candidimonas sp.]
MCHISSSIRPNFFEREIRSVRLKGYVTSMGLEEEFWTVLKGLAKDEDMSISRLLAQLYDEYVAQASNSNNFASFLRVSCMEVVRNRQRL